MLDVYTVGAFAAHNLGYDRGGFQALDDLDAKTPTNNNRDVTLPTPVRVWRAMRNYFRVSSLSANLIAKLGHLSAVLVKIDQCRTVQDERESVRIANDLDHIASQLVAILNPNDVELSLLSLDALRTELDDSLNGHGKRNEDKDMDIEPVDLLHLNIRASLISVASKLNSSRTASCADFEPAKRKLIAGKVLF